MKVGEYRFTDYYHQFMTIEADDLTEELKDQIEIHDDEPRDWNLNMSVSLSVTI